MEGYMNFPPLHLNLRMTSLGAEESQEPQKHKTKQNT